MARIKIYDNDPTISGGDKVLGTDEVTGGTKNFTVEALGDHILSDNLSGVPDGYIPKSNSGEPITSLTHESIDEETFVTLPDDFVFNLSRDGEGFVITLTGYGTDTFFPYDVNSFVGKTWFSGEYGDDQTGQTITSILGFTQVEESSEIIWRFRTTINNPASEDAVAGTIGRDLTFPVISSLDRITTNVGSGMSFRRDSSTTGTTTTKVLVDYEEGSWTPTVIGLTNTDPSFSTNELRIASGNYTKIGDIVHLFGNIAFHPNTDTSNVAVRNLPFPPSVIANTLQYTGNMNLFTPPNIIQASGECVLVGGSLLFLLFGTTVTIFDYTTIGDGTLSFDFKYKTSS